MAKNNWTTLYPQKMGEMQHFEFPSIYEDTEYQTTTIEHLKAVFS